MKSWTILIDMMAKKDPTFAYPNSRKEAESLYGKHDIYNEYVQMREQELHQLRIEVGQLKMHRTNITGQGQSEEGHREDLDELNCKYLAMEYCIGFFETYKYKGAIPKAGAGAVADQQ